MLIRVDALAPVVALLDTAFFWVIIWSLGLLSDSLRFLSSVPSSNTIVLPMLFLRLVGFNILSFIVLFQLLLLFIVTMLVLCICFITLFIINALNISRWIFILFVKKLNVVTFGFFMFLLDIRLQIFLPSVFLKFCLIIFISVSASVSLPIKCGGCNRVVYFSYHISKYLYFGNYIVS